ncbi:MAG: hypothetical protein HQL30_06415 [Candidatus Omnitrophica bacterium]|nr:hypothetical protein [Candidatus Omnitrophota bacterium]
MSFDKLIEKYLSENLVKKEKASTLAVEKAIQRSLKDLESAKANLAIDEGISYTVAYLAMLRAGRALMLLKGYRPSGEYQHRTVVEFVGQLLGKDYEAVIDRFDKMRKKRNLFTYEIDITISGTEARNAF